jgi:hypothetical protein
MVKLSRYQDLQAQRVVDVQDLLDNRLRDGGAAFKFTGRPPFTPQDDSSYIYLLQFNMSRPQERNAAGRFKSNEECSNLIGHRIRWLPAYGVLFQPTTLPRVPSICL